MGKPEGSSTFSFDEFDEINCARDEPTEFSALAERLVSRRSILVGTVAFGAAAFATGTGLLAPRAAGASAGRLAFEPVAANCHDTITVPEGYGWHVVASWGDPLWTTGAEFNHTSRGTGASQELALGDNNDGMGLFDVDGRTVLVVNHEYVNPGIMYANRRSRRPENIDDIRKGKAGHGVSIVEIRYQGGRWGIVRDSPHNRRITADTPMEITGPARGHDLLKTSADPTGTRSLGTWNNCGSGSTPWGTYLTCEENFNVYFSSSDPSYKPSPEMKRYGVGNKERGFAWAVTDERFDISKNPHEPNRAGYIVEIDPARPDAKPKKRTALGRFKHENAEVVVAPDGRVVVYSGDDEGGEFLYRFVSASRYVEGSDNADLLEDGTLYVAKFADSGTGEWIELSPQATGMRSKAEISIFTRHAASAVGATTMDRPEWVAANPRKAEAYCALTNNRSRGRKPNAGGDAMPVGGPNPRARNIYGQIVRWTPDDGDHAAPGFAWDLFVVAGNPTVHSDANRGSKNVDAGNMFSSPDGLAFDTKGRLWIQTDGNYSNEGNFAGQGNNQMLLGDPQSGEIRRFLVGPNECEITGLCWSADRRTMFVGVQHPGERGKGNSHFPGGGDTAPRSSVVAVTRNDGGEIG